MKGKADRNVDQVHEMEEGEGSKDMRREGDGEETELLLPGIHDRGVTHFPICCKENTYTQLTKCNSMWIPFQLEINVQPVFMRYEVVIQISIDGVLCWSQEK